MVGAHQQALAGHDEMCRPGIERNLKMRATVQIGGHTLALAQNEDGSRCAGVVFLRTGIIHLADTAQCGARRYRNGAHRGMKFAAGQP